MNDAAHRGGVTEATSHLGDAQPVVGLLHGLAGVVHRLGLVPLIPVGTQTCRMERRQVHHLTTTTKVFCCLSGSSQTASVLCRR